MKLVLLTCAYLSLVLSVVPYGCTHAGKHSQSAPIPNSQAPSVNSTGNGDSSGREATSETLPNNAGSNQESVSHNVQQTGLAARQSAVAESKSQIGSALLSAVPSASAGFVTQPGLPLCPAVLAVDVGPDINGLIAGLNDPTITGQTTVAGLNGATTTGDKCAYTFPPQAPIQ